MPPLPWLRYVLRAPHSFAAAQGRTVSEESLPERGLFFRADHFSMAKRGVPVMLMMGIAGASDLVEGGTDAGQAWVDAYTGDCYHAACDAWSEDWNLAGAVEDIALFRDMGAELANSEQMLIYLRDDSWNERFAAEVLDALQVCAFLVLS